MVVTYTVLGGIKAVTWSDVQQMCVIFLGLVVALVTVIVLLPHSVSFGDAVYLAGAAGRLNAVTTNFDWNDRFNIWSGLIGGTFLFLSYFGCDQSQVQRYLTGKSIAQSRLSLLFNAVAKIPMQFFILFIGRHGVRVLPVRPAAGAVPARRAGAHRAGRRVPAGAAAYQQAFERAARRRRWRWWPRTTRRSRAPSSAPASPDYRAAQKEMDARATRAAPLVEQTGGEKGFSDTNYIFLSFVTRYLPVGIVGLVIAVIFAATMSSSSGEINSLATVTVVDIYRRHVRREATRPPLSDGLALGHAVLGRLRGGLRRMAASSWGR